MINEGLHDSNDIAYSIIICAYNPDDRILQRCLQAVHNLDLEGIRIEVILSDNNSTVPVSQLPAVLRFKDTLPGLKMLRVPEQGVVHARMAGIAASSGKYIVYFDYDNEPAASYLQELKKLQAEHHEVAAWGPGHVWVDFVDGIDRNIEDYARIAFQERHEKAVIYDNSSEWQTCYPFGTGLCTRASLLKEYVRLAKEGRFTLSGRQGERLSSGEDTQMVLLCIRRGYAAGVSPTLQLRHMIPAGRANPSYLRRLAFGTSLCYDTCLVQVFPEYRSLLEKKFISGRKFLKQTLKQYLKTLWNKDPHKMFDLARYLGANAGVYLALNKPLPSTVARLVRIIKVD